MRCLRRFTGILSIGIFPVKPRPLGLTRFLSRVIKSPVSNIAKPGFGPLIPSPPPRACFTAPPHFKRNYARFDKIVFSYYTVLEDGYRHIYTVSVRRGGGGGSLTYCITASGKYRSLRPRRDNDKEENRSFVSYFSLCAFVSPPFPFSGFSVAAPFCLSASSGFSDPPAVGRVKPSQTWSNLVRASPCRPAPRTRDPEPKTQRGGQARSSLVKVFARRDPGG